MPPSNEKRPAGRQPGKALKFKAGRERIYDASNHDASQRQDLQGRLWMGAVQVGDEHREDGNPAARLAGLRLREIERLIQHRFTQWGQLPGLPEILQAAYALNRIRNGGYMPALGKWCERWAPDAVDHDGRLLREIAEPILGILSDRIQISKARDCGVALELNASERRTLGIRTIAAVDVTKASLEAERKERDRQRKQEQRRKAGVKPRAVYEAGSVTRMISAAGISRATHYRNLKRETGVSTIGMRSIPQLRTHLSHHRSEENEQ